MEEFQRTNPLARGDENIKPLEVYAEHAEIREQVYNEIKKLHETLDSQIWESVYIIIDRFLNCIDPIENLLYDLGRLPICRSEPKGMVPDKQKCVWALVSCLVQAYWNYELESGVGDKLVVLILLDDLKKINEHYLEMKIVGAENKGFWLELG